MEIEHGLLPMGVLSVRACRELDRLMAFGELDIEPSDEGMNKVVPADIEGERSFESEVRGVNRIEVERDDGGRISHDSFHVNRIHQRLTHCSCFEWSVVETPNIIPD